MVYFFKYLIQFLACILDVYFLFMWLEKFSKRKKRNIFVKSVVLLVPAAVLSYVNCIENAVFSVLYVLLGLLAFLFMSFMLFEERIQRLFLYTIINYVIGLSIGVMFELVPAAAGISSDMYLTAGVRGIVSAFIMMAAEKSLRFFVYYMAIRLFSGNGGIRKPDAVYRCMEKRYGLMYYALFYSVPVIVYIFMAAIHICCNVTGHSAIAYGIVVIGVIGIIVINLIEIYLYEENAIISVKNNELELEILRQGLEGKYYSDLDKIHEQYDVFLHDIRHTLRTIAALSKEEGCEKINRLVEEMRTSLGKVDEQLICSHKMLNALLSERKAYAEDNGVNLNLEISEPIQLYQIKELDFIIMIGNLLDNAIEAQIRSGRQEGLLCSMRMARDERHLLIQVENSYKGKTGKSSIRGRIGSKHGIGISSAQEIVRKYGGIFESKKDDAKYNVKVILPLEKGWNGEDTYSDSLPIYVQSAFK